MGMTEPGPSQGVGLVWPGPPPPPHHFLSTVQPQYNKGSRDWQNIFVTMRFINLYQGFFFYIALYFTISGVKKNILLDRGLCYIEVPL